MLATSVKIPQTHFIRFVFDKSKLVLCFYGILSHLREDIPLKIGRKPQNAEKMIIKYVIEFEIIF